MDIMENVDDGEGEVMLGDNRTIDDVIDAVIAQSFQGDAKTAAALARAKGKPIKKRGGAAVKAVAKALQWSRGHRDEALRCIGALRALAFCSGGLCTPQDFCGNSGIGAAIGALRTYSHDAEVKARALELLTTCAESSPEACLKVIAGGGYRAALWVLGDLCWDAGRATESRALLRVCAVFCATLVDYHSECRDEEVDSKYLRPIVERLGECSLRLGDDPCGGSTASADDEALRADAVLCTFIKYFSLDWLENIPAVCAAGGVPVAIDALQRHVGYPSVVRRACFLLGKLSIMSKALALEAVEKGAVLPVLDVLENVLLNTDAVHAVACYALGALAMQTAPDPTVPDAVLAHEGLAAIAGALRAAEPDGKDVVKQGTFALAVLASSAAHVPALLGDPNVHDALVGVLRNEACGHSACRNVLYALWRMAVAAENAKKAKNGGDLDDDGDSDGEEEKEVDYDDDDDDDDAPIRPSDVARTAADAAAGLLGITLFPDVLAVQRLAWDLLAVVGVPSERVRDAVGLIAQALVLFEGNAAVERAVLGFLAAPGSADVRERLSTEDTGVVTRMLIATVRRYPADEGVQAAGLRALQGFPAMYACVDHLVDTLCAFPAAPAVLEPCFACLVNAAEAVSGGGAEVGAALESRRCVQAVVVAMARSRGGPETQRAALRVLWAIARRGPSAQRRIVGAEGIGAIVGALASGSSSSSSGSGRVRRQLLVDAYAILAAFTAPESAVRAAAVHQLFDKGAIEATIAAIKDNTDDERLAALACQTLGNIASYSPVYAAYACCMGASGAVSHALTCFPRNAAVRRACTPALEKVFAAGSSGSSSSSLGQDVPASDLIDFLNAYPGNESIQEKGLRTLDALARSSRARADEILRYMGADTAGAALERFPASRPVHLAAAALIGSLAEPAPAPADRNLPFCGCIRPLVTALATFRADEELLCCVLRALAAACTGPCDIVQAALLGCGGLPAVLAVLRGGGPSAGTAAATHTAHTALLRQRACAVLAAATQGFPEAQAIVAADPAPGGVSAILAAMEEFPHSAELQVEACSALGNVLASDITAVARARRAVEARAAGLVAEALAIGTAEAQAAGCYALAGVLRGSPHPDPKALEAALRALERFPYRMSIQRYGCAVLAEAAAVAALGPLGEDRVIPRVLSALQVSHSCTTDEEVAAFEAACTVLSALAHLVPGGARPSTGRDDPAAAQIIYKADVARAILVSPRPGPAALLLLGVISGRDKEVQAVVGREGGVETLVASLAGDENTTARALYALHSVCEVNAPNESALVRCAGPSAVVNALLRFPTSSSVNSWGVSVLLLLARAGPATCASVLSSMINNNENNEEKELVDSEYVDDDDEKEPIDSDDDDDENDNIDDKNNPNKLIEVLLGIIERFSAPPSQGEKEPGLVVRNSLALLSLLSDSDVRVKAFLRGGSRLRALSSAILSVSADAAALASGYAALASIARGPCPCPIAPESAESVLAAALRGMEGAPDSEPVQSSGLEVAAAVLPHLPPGQRARAPLAAAAFRALAAFPDSALVCERAFCVLAGMPPRAVFGDAEVAAERLDAVVLGMNRFVLHLGLVVAGCQVLGNVLREAPELRTRLGQRGGVDAVRRAVAAHPQAEELRRCGAEVIEELAACDVIRASFGDSL